MYNDWNILPAKKEDEKYVNQIFMNYSQKELLRVFISTVQDSVNLNAQGTEGF